MTDKEKLDAIRAEIHRLVDVRGYDKGMANDLFAFMDSLPNEPVNKNFEMALAEMIDKAQKCVVEPLVVAEQWKDELIKIAKCEEPVSEDLEEAASRYAKEEYSHKNPATLPDRCIGCYAPIMYAFKAGAKWQKENLWKPANGDDLPEIDREVIALLDNGKVVFAHRPPEFWDGKDIMTGKVTRYYPKTYDKGGWNIPNVKYWLDCQIPNMRRI